MTIETGARPARRRSRRLLAAALVAIAVLLIFLPYQLHYTAEQLTRSYPEVRAFFEAKRRYDPAELFVNTFYERFGKRPRVSSGRCRRWTPRSHDTRGLPS